MAQFRIFCIHLRNRQTGRATMNVLKLRMHYVCDMLFHALFSTVSWTLAFKIVVKIDPLAQTTIPRSHYCKIPIKGIGFSNLQSLKYWRKPKNFSLFIEDSCWNTIRLKETRFTVYPMHNLLSSHIHLRLNKIKIRCGTLFPFLPGSRRVHVYMCLCHAKGYKIAKFTTGVNWF